MLTINLPRNITSDKIITNMADRLKLSNSQLLMITEAMLKVGGAHGEEVILSKDTIRLNREFNRNLEAKRIRIEFVHKAADYDTLG